MVGLVVGLDGPIHTGGKVVLIRLAPPPDRGVIVCVPPTVDAHDLVLGIGPEGPGFGLKVPFFFVRSIQLVATAPAAPLRMLGMAQAVVN